MERFDAVVIGGGAAGTSCLYHLARRGVHAVLVEREHLAAGSSGRSAAFIETQYTDPDRVRLTVYGERLLERFAAEHDFPFVQHGKLWLARDERDLDAYGRSAEFQRSLGVEDAAVIDAAEVARVAPSLLVDDLAGALYGPRDGYVDPPRLCQLFVDLSGAEVRRARVTGIAAGAVETTGGELACDAVVNAAGAWAREVAALAGLDVPVAGHRREIVVLEGGDGDLPLVVEPLGDAGDGLYLRGDGGDLLVVGIHSHATDEPVDPDAYRESVDAETERELAALVRRRLRDGDALRLRGGWAGLYPLTPDGLPIVGAAEEAPWFWNLAGLGGNGIQLSPGLGRVLADLVVDGRTELLPDVEPYRLERFNRTGTTSRPG